MRSEDVGVFPVTQDVLGGDVLGARDVKEVFPGLWLDLRHDSSKALSTESKPVKAVASPRRVDLG
ncbi:MAG: hypothetical protein QM778_21655 [Myxococcales bacterium]